MAVRGWRKAVAPLVLLGLLLATAISPGWACRAEMAAIRAYQQNVSPWMGRLVQCRYKPTCSHYALQSLKEEGFFVGNWRIAKRLALCSPLGLLTEEG